MYDIRMFSSRPISKIPVGQTETHIWQPPHLFLFKNSEKFFSLFSINLGMTNQLSSLITIII
jgi:hypothetical protein